MRAIVSTTLMNKDKSWCLTATAIVNAVFFIVTQPIQTHGLLWIRTVFV